MRLYAPFIRSVQILEIVAIPSKNKSGKQVFSNRPVFCCVKDFKSISHDVIKKRIPNKWNYRTREEIFDNPSSKTQLTEMIDKYAQKSEVLMTLITIFSNVTFLLL